MKAVFCSGSSAIAAIRTQWAALDSGGELEWRTKSLRFLETEI